MKNYIVISSNVGETHIAPCVIGVTNNLSRLRSAFLKVAFAHRARFGAFRLKPSPQAVFKTGLDLFKGKEVTSTKVDFTSRQMIHKFDDDCRFSRFEEIDDRTDPSLIESTEIPA